MGNYILYVAEIILKHMRMSYFGIANVGGQSCISYDDFMIEMGWNCGSRFMQIGIKLSNFSM